MMMPSQPKEIKFAPQIPVLDLSEGREMLTEFIAESLKHLLTAKNSLLVLETVPEDRESIDTVFKSFHTIKGLADFLNLKDIHLLTQESENLLNLARRNVLKFDQKISRLTSEAIDGLHKLIELLNEQLNQNGQLKSPYHNIGPVVAAIQEVTTAVEQHSAIPAVFERDIPTISTDDAGPLPHLRGTAARKPAVDQASYFKIVAQLEETKRELERAQGKLAERQRETIKERELAIKLTQQAQATARAKSEYLATMAHEIRTLINAILGFADLVKRGPLNVKQKDQVETITLSGNLLMGIVNDILDLSKVEAGKLKLETIEFDLQNITEDVFKIIRTRLAGKPINLFYEIHERVPQYLKGDPIRIKQIFINLLDNAMKFTEKGEIGMVVDLLETPGKVSPPASTAKTLRFVIEDTGIGIPENRKNSVFESFTQVDASTTRLYGGSGLGLTLCKNYVEAMGGRIGLESAIGKGSKFIFVIPFSVGTEPEKKVTLEITQELHRKKIMITEGHERSRTALERLCQRLSLKVSASVATSQEAWNVLNSLRGKSDALPDVILVDLMSTDKSGMAFAQQVRQDASYKSLKLVATSSDLKSDISDQLTKKGFDDFLPKPFMADEFVRVLDRVFGYQTKERGGVSPEDLQKISCEGIKVLIVEDSLPNQELLKVHFENLGCAVEYAGNGQEAIEKIKSGTYDICFMDLQMPVMGGLEAVDIIRKQFKNPMPIVALTAAAMEEEKQRCLEAGMNDYLAKPFDYLQLKEIVVRHKKT